MPRTETLRIGICSCTNHFHDQLQGQQVRLRQRCFQLKEVVIPENQQRQAIKVTRIHFFLDMHRYGRVYSTTISTENQQRETIKLFRRLDMHRYKSFFLVTTTAIELTPNGPSRGKRLYIRSFQWEGRGIQTFSASWDRRTPPTREEIIRGIVEILREKEEIGQLKPWLQRLAKKPKPRQP